MVEDMTLLFCNAKGQGARCVPQDAFNSGDRETLLYVPAIVPNQSRPDYLAVIDVDDQSDTYQQVCCSR